jgi:L-methionine (R)-S-oxide reductase
MSVVDWELVCESGEALFEYEKDVIANLSNASALLHQELVSARGPRATNWVGFYLIRNAVVDPNLPRHDVTHDTPDDAKAAPTKDVELVLGPFQGKVACVRIALGRGVCGTAALTGKSQLVEDVHQFPGHIACDSNSNSEVVIPIFKEDNKLVGVIDIDCPDKNGFSQSDVDGLEKFAKLLAKYCDWSSVGEYKIL